MGIRGGEMRIVDEYTGKELTEAQIDTARGVLVEAMRAKPGAYETIDNVRKFALSDEDYEAVMVYRAYTEEELAERELQAAQIAYDESREEWEELLESLFSADSLADFLKLIIATRSRAIVAKRRKLRYELQAAQAKLRP